ncbi:MAG: shikimate kinase [Sharpea porci]|uniref:shikimate kinase n=1 Tax=Sharpea porci TaxID=2652286 RepID=UPI002409DA2F|nr:shikimate kinase [Sharpea porci]MDD6711111.1 shikimate kinase [Sharpea porci]
MKNIVLIGIMGAGKTTIGKKLSIDLNRPFIDMDEYLEKKYEMRISDMFKISEDYFRDHESACCQDMSTQRQTIISTGGGVIKRPENIAYLKKNGIIFYIDRPLDQIVGDVDTSSRPLLKDGAQKLYDLDRERRALYMQSCDYHLINDGGLEEICQKIIAVMKEEDA